MKNIEIGTKKARHQNTDVFYPVLIFQDTEREKQTITEVRVDTSDPLSNKKTALKYAEQWKQSLI
jgi:tRNA A22 N-methylase